MHIWTCSSSFFMSLTPGSATGVRSCEGDPPFFMAPMAGLRSFTTLLWLSPPAAVMKTLCGAYCSLKYLSTLALSIDFIVFDGPSIDQPSGCPSQNLSAKISWMMSSGVSSTIFISWRTTRRSLSISFLSNFELMKMSERRSMAFGRSLLSILAKKQVYSLPVKALRTPPTLSISIEMSRAVLLSVPLKRRCSMKCETPLISRVSNLEPVFTQMPMEDDSTSGISSVITAMPLSNLVFWTKDIGEAPYAGNFLESGLKAEIREGLPIESPSRTDC